ncbi:dihydrolipoamide acetyltransferase component of pyruvate dehydrogenase [Cucurbitaria berberidis CBS 394.84]|uniref:Acetyltransferase component of pyruvate dehydrogenase complex n=1 Tax=Cucurbitaria berberidis CBS 394.84 TaxID=1168544 RepID=A0A9P4GSA5_9PLEO|nr:dihydrolipoamide acetyltransferase component of pyruvate dehydrogenase [Cucurbitaria berberidis CBS 394.84]KAF1850546.1 dihydrolipoamide acetyltransferase component of pyruvate dehydrogenase [Cucurbitaria berberidis CBS 394.84]
MPATTTLLSRAGSQWSSRGSIALRGALATPRCSQFAARTPALAALSRYYASKCEQLLPLLYKQIIPYPSHTVINMPALSPTMTAGNIGAWQKKAGDSIAPGDVLVEIETDKAQMDFEFQEEGTIAKLLRDAGAKDVAVGSPIAVMVEEGEDVSAFEAFSIEDAGGDKKSDTPPKKDEASEAPKSESKSAPPKEESAPAAIESESTGDRLETVLQRLPAVSPAVKKLALEKGVPIGSIKGTGKGGKITKEDIEKYKPAGGAPAAGGAAGAPTYQDVEATSMRKVIAARLTESMQQNPHYFVASNISVSKLLKLREALNASADGKYKLSVNDLLVKALAVAARNVPAANSSWREESGKVVIRQHNVVDVSVAVSTPVGLMTPIVKNVNGLGLQSISSQIKDLGKRARDGKLKPEEYQGGTITISNMGMNPAVERFTAVINPPQATIVAIGTTKKIAVPGELTEDGTPSVEWDDQIVITGSFDHKVVDGAVGGEFMKELKKAIENPLELLL